jgi:hypothetical protein
VLLRPRRRNPEDVRAYKAYVRGSVYETGEV